MRSWRKTGAGSDCSSTFPYRYLHGPRRADRPPHISARLAACAVRARACAQRRQVAEAGEGRWIDGRQVVQADEGPATCEVVERERENPGWADRQIPRPIALGAHARAWAPPPYSVVRLVSVEKELADNAGMPEISL